MTVGIEVLSDFSPLSGGIMGIYQRENGIYYLQVFYEGRNRRISLETKNKRFAQQMHDCFLRGKVYQKLSKFHKTFDEKSTSQESKIKLSHVQI